MKKSLQKNSLYLFFNRKLNRYIKNALRNKVLSISMITLILIFSLAAAGTSEYAPKKIIDDINYAFVDDPMVIGKWEAVDYVKEPEEFIPGQRNFKGDLYLNALVFIKGGGMFSASDGSSLAYTTFTWTEGLVLSKQEKTASRYEIENIEGTDYMFFEWKSGDYTYRGRTPDYYVLKKVDSNDYSDFKPERIIEDKVDYTFENDSRMPGNWESVDFVDNIKDFTPGRRYWPGDLYISQMKFYAGGDMTIGIMRDGEPEEISNPSITWTGNMVVNRLNKTASKCEIRAIDGETFMFYEWKSGDYTYRGRKPSYYVLRKVN